MDANEASLVAISKVPANAGHSLHKGTPREAFIRGFLEQHLPADVAIGTGEIIDATSKPGEQRNQFDIVIYRKNYPKLDFGGGVSGFLIESVIATIEVKSTLTEADLAQAISAARNAKALAPNVTSAFHSGYIPPKVLNYVVAYDGPAYIKTIYGWLNKIHDEIGVTNLDIPPGARLTTPSQSVDGIFVLNKGFLYFDNVPFGFATDEWRSANPSARWIFADTSSGNLLLLFLMLQTATANLSAKWLNPVPYLASFTVAGVNFG
ncbi:DUF6602 domain-containing protein [Aminobacter niigataensis]|uniref:DUF6602 domain-containing protein n=1 Tax=Aminobacter niigataensis TaxID=83265 RepID=UPI00298EEE0C|nr:DUF6602 domain-containing protein [Aminobacter niigataensis]